MNFPTFDIPERALELTALCLRFNPANYTTWWFRRQCLASLSTPPTSDFESKYTYFSENFIANDLMLASKLGGSNPKNYQVWYHRRNLLEQSFSDMTSDSDTECGSVLELVNEELEYIAGVLDKDSKNYHAWSHRQWILKIINMESKWTAEIEYINDLLEADVRNNSAWNQRWLVSHRGSKSKPFPVEAASEEVNFVISKAREDPYNESPWRYFVALIKEQFRLIASSPEFVSLVDTCENALKEVKEKFELESKKDGMECTHLIAAHIDILEMKGDEDSLSSAVEFAILLESRYDPVRKKYWKLRAQQLQVVAN
mmetsp:Transcript_27858/g.41309  ORF Transcript_27858/g.41309 Transcript_27858/m.41309 type:complete len:314 (+) Transcript_27858:3-944(+)